MSLCVPGALHSTVQDTPETFGELEKTKDSVLHQTVLLKAAQAWAFLIAKTTSNPHKPRVSKSLWR